MSPPPPPAWQVIEVAGSADAFHRRDPGPAPGHQLLIASIPRPALVLGSTQPDELIDRDRAEADGIEVCRRRSGGGLVYLDPRTDCWIDAVVPARSPLWQDDVGTAFHWLGRCWAGVLDAAIGPAGPVEVNRPRPGGLPLPHSTTAPDDSPRRRRVTRPLWCFAELGHGEVSLGGSKIVGLSQRRTRHWTRLQSLVLGRWPGWRLGPYLDPAVAADLVAGAGSATLTNSEVVGAGLPPAADPAFVAAGPPAGITLPDVATLIERFVESIGADPPD